MDLTSTYTHGLGNFAAYLLFVNACLIIGYNLIRLCAAADFSKDCRLLVATGQT